MTMAPYQYGNASLNMLRGIDPGLCATAKLALDLSWRNGGPDWSIVDGVRTTAQQQVLFKQGHSKTLHSAHLIKPSGYGEAIDIRVWLAGINPFPLKGDTPATVATKLKRFEQVARYMFEAADELGYPLQWGNDWDVDGIPTGRDPDEKGYIQDMVHFQQAPPHRIEQARARAMVRRELRQSGQPVIS